MQKKNCNNDSSSNDDNKNNNDNDSENDSDSSVDVDWDGEYEHLILQIQSKFGFKLQDFKVYEAGDDDDEELMDGGDCLECLWEKVKDKYQEMKENSNEQSGQHGVSVIAFETLYVKVTQNENDNDCVTTGMKRTTTMASGAVNVSDNDGDDVDFYIRDHDEKKTPAQEADEKETETETEKQNKMNIVGIGYELAKLQHQMDRNDSAFIPSDSDNVATNKMNNNSYNENGDQTLDSTGLIQCVKGIFDFTMRHFSRHNGSDKHPSVSSLARLESAINGIDQVYSQYSVAAIEIVNDFMGLFGFHIVKNNLNGAAESDAYEDEKKQEFVMTGSNDTSHSRMNLYSVDGTLETESIDAVSKHFNLIDEAFYAFERDDLKWLSNHGQRVYPYILKSLGIDLSKLDNDNNKVVQHESGLYSKKFILFSLHELEYENRDSTLIKKSLLRPKNVERFINYLSPNGSKNNGSKIDFKNSLANINVKSVGIFGNKEKICKILLKLQMADEDMYVFFCSLCFTLFCFVTVFLSKNKRFLCF